MHTFAELSKHFAQEHNQAGYTMCCKKKFSRILSISSANPEYFKCNISGNAMSDRICLAYHFNSHKFKDKSKICDACGKSFTRNLFLKRHRLTHLPDEERRYRCQEYAKLYVRYGLF